MRPNKNSEEILTLSHIVDEWSIEKQLDGMIRSFVKEKLETLMKEEMENFFTQEHPELKSSKNGSYPRRLDTKYGRIDPLSVPRDRENYFHTQLFQPYKRQDDWLGSAIITLYQKGMSTRDLGKFIETILGDHYSAGTISKVTEVVREDVEAFQKHPLKKRYAVVFLDGTYLKLRRDHVASEVVYVAIGITPEGYREILGFYVGGQESSLGWKDILIDLYNRGMQEVLLAVFDGLPGLTESLKEIYPKANVQRCVLHKVRHSMHKVRQSERQALAVDLRRIYRVDSKEQAQEAFQAFEKNWQKLHPSLVESWRKDLPALLTFLNYPKDIRASIYTSNIIESTHNVFKQRVKTIRSFPEEQAVEKVFYLVAKGLNQKWERVKMPGFVSAQSEIQKMFEKRYGI